ncbi:DUF502 domain-containing protein [Rhodovulum sulfidophilum]|uniref:DUF502 domain-containing protein n=1 Tax=Rhodovulum sulfidophilum TaxID=35806 RepID=UPI0009520288|nr:DUF502 domain-containing protein [Rhodovulum sulfidophilum]MBL3551298.1 DUF502 domain-containing protein [Rhodovulum sulfidophilum]MBL3562757.1 DUF502 domain-containing protein [Rhodovulum sulfidophilum]MBL3566063.1 DUF502 domain-containing protein [Rhodovulum sulfidophilum]OLS48660.1 hypothetical protein BV379_10540 [Rhodovulum sulfidophilum]OLS51569.1 hypothetical protein BV392_05760 [Rhodovulum sulfidophilum]
MFESKEPTAEPSDPQEPHQRRFWRGVLARLRNNFLAGLVVIAPVGLTVWLIWTVTGWIDGFVLPFVPQKFQPEQYIGIDIRGLGVIFFLVFTLVVGWMAKGMVGRSFIGWGERVVGQMPVIRSVYNGLKQIAETVFAQTETSFDRVVLIQYPRPGIWAIAFVSTNAKGEIRRLVPADDPILSVFLPTTPNPTSGFLLFVPQSDVIELDMSVEEAAKLVISAGLVAPEDPQVLAAAAAAAPRPIQQAARRARDREKIGA